MTDIYVKYSPRIFKENRLNYEISCGVPASLMQLLYDVWKRSTINHKLINSTTSEMRKISCEKFEPMRNMISLECFSAKYFSSPGIVEFVFYSVAKWKSEANQMLVFWRIFSLLWISTAEKLFYERNFSHKCVFARNFWHFARRGNRPLDSIFPTKLTEFVPFIFIISQYCPNVKRILPDWPCPQGFRMRTRRGTNLVPRVFFVHGARKMRRPW